MGDNSWKVPGENFYGAIDLTVDTNVGMQGHVITNDTLAAELPKAMIHFTDSHGEEHDISADWFDGAKLNALKAEARSRYGNRSLSQTALFELAYELERKLPEESDDGDWF